jgi:CheY-like chemotaxis protein
VQSWRNPPVTRRILIVEDDPGIRDLLDTVIRRAGVTTMSVSDVFEALAALEQNTFCAVFLDLMMPRMSGYDLIAHIRDTRPSLPVVVLTAVVKSLQSDRLDPSVVKAVLTKPFEIDDVVSAIETVCPAGK